MEVTSDLLSAARKGKRAAVVELLAMHYAMVWRMATGLTGRRDVGRGVAKFVMQRSLRVLPRWAEESAPSRWFQHHTVLATRRASKHQPASTNDTLLGPPPQPADLIAFLHALRSLPMQQREAVILHHGERFGPRHLSIAMDCSIIAAENHLREGTTRLQQLAGPRFDEFVKHIGAMYSTLGPDEEMSIKDIRKRVRRFVLPWILRRTLATVASLLLLTVAIWAGWWTWRIVRHSMGS